MEINTNKKLVFEENLDQKNNRGYIKALNDSFLKANFGEIEKFKKQIDICMKNDIDTMIQSICNSEQEKTKRKFGIYTDGENNKMSNLMRQWCYLMDHRSILWEILNTNKNCEGEWQIILKKRQI